MTFKINNDFIFDPGANGTFGSVWATTRVSTALALSPTFQGTTHGYNAGGADGGFTVTNIIDRFPFATVANATDVGDLAAVKSGGAGASSSTHGYTAGGLEDLTIQKFNFSTGGSTSATIGQMFSEPGTGHGGGQWSTTHGYVVRSSIQRFPFSTDSNSTITGYLTYGGAQFSGGCSSFTHGHTVGGQPTDLWGGTRNNTWVDRFPFAVESPASLILNLEGGRYQGPSSSSSSSHGYAAGSMYPGGYYSRISKFSFATTATAVVIGSLVGGYRTRFSTGNSSVNHGHACGGRQNYFTPGQPVTNNIERYPFSSDTNASDIADLSRLCQSGTGSND